MRAALLSLCLVVVTGCKVKNPNYCEGEPNDLCMQPDAPPMQCEDSSDCTGAEKICKMPENVCVECIAATDCTTQTEPVCSAMNRCEPCSKSADCPTSGVCLDDGSCAVPTNVLYVKAGAANSGDCSMATPCGSVTYALTVSPPRSLIKIEGTIDETSEVQLNNRDIAIYGETTPALATLRRTNGNEIIRIDGTSAVSIFDLKLTGATGNNGHAIAILGGSTGTLVFKRLQIVTNQGLGISALGGGPLHLSQSNIFDNDGGGATFEGTHTLDVTGNFFTYNGKTDNVAPSEKGGVRITANRMGSKFEFNTVAFNGNSGLLYRGGLHCQAPNVSAKGNIVYRNSENMAGTVTTDATTQAHTSPNPCVYGNSLILADDSVHLGFKAPLTNPFDFHLDAAKVPVSVKDAGGACTGRDVDGQTRPSGAACELGADELAP